MNPGLESSRINNKLVFALLALHFIIIEQFFLQNEKIKLFPLFNYTYKRIVGFSMIVMSFDKRIKVLNTFLNFTLTNPPKSLSEIVISWGSNDDSSIKEIINNYSIRSQQNDILLRYSISEDKSLSRKFRDAESIKTSTILAIDDDILMPPENIEYGFQIWKKHPTQLVGYLARYISIQKAAMDGRWDNLTYEVPGNFNRIRLILTNVAFVSRYLALAYYKPNNKENLNLVHELNNCEDILMNFVAMNESNLSAVFILRNYEHIGLDGLSTTLRKSHFPNRNVCVNKFYRSFGRYPPIIPKELLYLK